MATTNTCMHLEGICGVRPAADRHSPAETPQHDWMHALGHYAEHWDALRFSSP